MTHRARHKNVSWNFIDRVQYREIANSLILQQRNEPPPRATVLLCLYSSCHQFSGDSSIAWCVTSRCNGVTEM